MSHTSTTSIKGVKEQFDALTNVVTSDGIVTGKGTGTEASNAVTINHASGKITTSSLSTAAGSSYTITLTNSAITSSSYLMLTKGAYSGSTGTPNLEFTSATSGAATIKVNNVAASGSLNGTLVIYFTVV